MPKHPLPHVADVLLSLTKIGIFESAQSLGQLLDYLIDGLLDVDLFPRNVLSYSRCDLLDQLGMKLRDLGGGAGACLSGLLQFSTGALDRFLQPLMLVVDLRRRDRIPRDFEPGVDLVVVNDRGALDVSGRNGFTHEDGHIAPRPTVIEDARQRQLKEDEVAPRAPDHPAGWGLSSHRNHPASAWYAATAAPSFATRSAAL